MKCSICDKEYQTKCECYKEALEKGECRVCRKFIQQYKIRCPCGQSYHLECIKTQSGYKCRCEHEIKLKKQIKHDYGKIGLIIYDVIISILYNLYLFMLPIIILAKTLKKYSITYMFFLLGLTLLIVFFVWLPQRIIFVGHVISKNSLKQARKILLGFVLYAYLMIPGMHALGYWFVSKVWNYSTDVWFTWRTGLTGFIIMLVVTSIMIAFVYFIRYIATVCKEHRQIELKVVQIKN